MALIVLALKGATGYLLQPARAPVRTGAHTRATVRAVIAEPPKDVQTDDEPGNSCTLDSGNWCTLESGIKYVDEEVGAGPLPAPDAVVSLTYTVSLASYDLELGTNKGRWPLTFAPSKHAVPIFAESIEGMRVGGKRRVAVPADKIPPSQLRNVPQDSLKSSRGEGLRIEIELTRVETGPVALFASILPPGDRRLTVTRFLFFLSFLPYLLPEELKPEMYKWGDVETIAANRQAAQATMQVLGGSTPSLEDTLALLP